MERKAIVASDWNECLAPCGPFDPIPFAYPRLASVPSVVDSATFRMTGE
jgi:hypothetical protein